MTGWKPFGPAATLADLVIAAAERAPDHPALSDRGATITWGDAATATGRLRAALHRAGIGSGDRVGVHYRKSPESFLAMHAVVSLGAVAVPLDPGASTDYLTTVIGRTGCRLVLSHEVCRPTATVLASAPGIEAMIGLDCGPSSVPAAEVDEFDPIGPAVGIDPDDPAYLITTSGSTGVPKGICHTHASALAYVRFKLSAYDYRPEDRIGDIAPNHFDISTQALWVTPAVGATNVIVSEQHQLFPASLADLMAEEAMTVWYGVPYLLTQLLTRGGLAERDLSALRWVLFGGEVFPPRVLADLMAALPHARFSNVYGPAEVNACTIHHLSGPPVGEDPVPIGVPYADTEVRLVDPDRVEEADPAAGAEPDGGELWVSAPTMMRGYWEQPELDAASIVERDGQRWYRTGDLGHRLDSGELVFTGRVDHQVKVRGYRIELESIESVLEDLPGVDYAIATVARSDDGSDVVVAGIITEADVPIDAAALTAGANAHLPAYAVPTRYYPVASKPVTGSGKLNRRIIRTELVERVRE